MCDKVWTHHVEVYTLPPLHRHTQVEENVPTLMTRCMEMWMDVHTYLPCTPPQVEENVPTLMTRAYLALQEGDIVAGEQRTNQVGGGVTGGGSSRVCVGGEGRNCRRGAAH